MNEERARRLQREIEAARAQCENEIECMTAAAREEEEQEEIFAAARTVRSLYDAYLTTGFTEAQAWELVKIAVGCCPAEGACGRA